MGRLADISSNAHAPFAPGALVEAERRRGRGALTRRSGRYEKEVREEIDRILQLWAQARARFGGTGDFLFGDWCAADMMYAPVVTRLITYGVPVPNFAGVYMKNVLSQPHVAEWIDEAQDEPWVIDQYEAA